jgi:hypothetical protein
MIQKGEHGICLEIIEAPPHTAVHKLSHQLLNFRSCTSLGR